MRFHEQINRLSIQVQDLQAGLIAQRDANRRDFSAMRQAMTAIGEALDRVEERIAETEVSVLSWLQQVLDTVRSGATEHEARFESLEGRVGALERRQAG